MWPSLAVALPTFLIGIWVNICVALLVVMFHATRLDRWTVLVFVALMSISYLFYIIGGQHGGEDLVGMCAAVQNMTYCLLSMGRP